MSFTTPDVYVREIKVFPPSVAEVETAVPAFVGYTAKAKRDTDGDLNLKPIKIYSMTEFERFFGRDPALAYAVTVTALTDGTYKVDLPVATGDPTPPYLLYHSVRMFFDNGGGQCYIVSVGTYKNAAPFVVKDELKAGLDKVALEDEPTLLVVPEAVKLAYTDYKGLAPELLKQCFTLGDRFALFDFYAGYLGPEDPITTGGPNADDANRDALVGDLDHLKYGAAYYPYLRTTLTPNVDETKVTVAVTGGGSGTLDVVKNGDTAKTAPFDKPQTAIYNAVKAAFAGNYLVLPPSGAVAGVYAYTDTARGVWKAPANVPLSDVIEPAVKIDGKQQGLLNVDDTSGKSINAVRAFTGKGTLVWGARTLAGNDNEWRYVNVRRFFNMVEESVKKSTYWAVFESNDANTWSKVRGMIESYLTQKWREGALAGASPKDAFFVRCGLGTTMTGDDILNGIMNVEIGMAVVRPAEFIVLKFSHKMQVS